MKRGALNFLGRKNQSLFDTNVKMKERDNVELVLESSAIPESGTASVRARPTVKHHNSSLDSFQGFAVPTPRVPLFPRVSVPNLNGSVTGDHLSNGSMHDFAEEEIFVPPPPPSMAPPPPPGTFIPPPPDFMGDLNSLDLATRQPPPMSALKPTSMALSMGDLTSLKPPPMAPPKPPSTCSTGSSSSIPISTPLPAIIPEHPSFAPPQPPSEKQHKTYKTPPPKPVRLSSIPTHDSPPQTPAPPPPVQTPTLSTFNPQNTAKLYNIPKVSILSRYEDRDTRPKQMLLLEDSGSVKSAPVLVQVDGNAPKVVSSSKPVSKDVQELKENLQITQPSPSPQLEPDKETTTAPPEIVKPLQNLHQTLPQPQKVHNRWVNSEPSKGKLEKSPSQSLNTGTFSPMIDCKLRNLKSSETSGPREGPVASPLALLMAAKERDRQRSTQSLSQQNSCKKNEQLSATIHPSDSSPNSFIVTPRSSLSSSLTSQDTIQDNPESASPVERMQTVQSPQISSSPALVKDQMPSTSLSPNITAASPSATNLVPQKQNAEQSPSQSQSTHDKEELSMPLLPPPPEFDDLEEIMDPPPSTPPPDPPMKKAPAPVVSPLLPAQVPAPPPKPKLPAAPKWPPPNTGVKLKPPVQEKPKVANSQLPSNLSTSQTTLLSILQKKMLEMDHKIAPVKEAESSSDDWGTSFSEGDSEVSVFPRATPQSKNYPVVNKAATLDMRELEGKVVKKCQEMSSTQVPTSNGLQSKHQYGMTFTVRPGTKQPITLVNKGESQ